MLKTIKDLSKTIIVVMKSKFKEVLDIGPNCYERFIDLDNAPEIAELGIQMAGSSNLSGRYHVSRIKPADHTLFYTLAGQGTLTTMAGSYDLVEHSLAVLPANAPFSVKINAQQWDIIWLNLCDIDKWQYIPQTLPTVLYNQNLESLHLALELLYREKEALLRKSMIEIIDSYLSKALSKVDKTPESQRLINLFSAVEKQLHFNWSIQAMSEYVHYSPPHLHRLCLKQFNRSPIQQLIFLRIERAKYLLRNTAWPISQIAHYVGYSEIFNFSKRFKKSVGLSPSRFRQKK